MPPAKKIVSPKNENTHCHLYYFWIQNNKENIKDLIGRLMSNKYAFSNPPAGIKMVSSQNEYLSSLVSIVQKRCWYDVWRVPIFLISCIKNKIRRQDNYCRDILGEFLQSYVFLAIFMKRVNSFLVFFWYVTCM